jgi:hypothetical protein
MTIKELKTWIEALECVEGSDAKVYLNTSRDGKDSLAGINTASIKSNGCQQDPQYYLLIS